MTSNTVQAAPEFQGRLKRAEILATVIRADGTVEELGVIAASHFDTPDEEGPTDGL